MLKQFVPSEVCLKCKGCCRYKEAESAWRPKLGAEDRLPLGDLINNPAVLDRQSYIKTVHACGEHFCRFLDRAGNTCGIYAQRPFECSLYPFVLSKTAEALKAYVHLSCPYVQDHFPGTDFDAYVGYLKDFFKQKRVQDFLSQNKTMLHDYSPYAPELLYLFDLPLNP